MKLGIDTFSLRTQGWDAIRLLDYASSLGLDVVHFSEIERLDSLDPDSLSRIKAHADTLGIAIEVGMRSICPTSSLFDASRGSAVDQLSTALRTAKALGSPVVRCFLGANADRSGPIEAHIEKTVATCKAVRNLADELGIKIAVENHAGDMQGRELKALIEEAGSDFVGACIDTGNAVWVAESPFVTLEHLAPYVLMAHIRDSVVCPHPRGAVAQWVPVGDGNVGIGAWATRFREQCPQVNFTLEIIGNVPPRVLPYLGADYWTLYPHTPASEFARFVALAQAGSPYTQPCLTTQGDDSTPEIQSALALQERRHVEQSVRYCRDRIGI